MSKPDVGELEEEYVLSAVRSGWIAPLGPDVDAFEAEISERTGVRHAVALSSGTAALHLGLLSLGVGRGDIVVTSTMTFAATANAVAYTGATPFFVDSDPMTGNIDPELLDQALAELQGAGTPASAVVPVDLLGKAADYSRIESICAVYEVPLFCDAAESLGAFHRGKAAGSFGRAGVFSFNGNKIMTTSGGGMFVTDDEMLAQNVRYLSTQARQPVVHYEHTDVGYNYRMSNILAALGRAQLSRLDEMISRRQQWRARYKDFFEHIPGIEVFGGTNDTEDNCWLSSIVVDSTQTTLTARDLQAKLDRDGIESRPLWKPMHLQPVFRGAPRLVNGSSESLFENGLTLPSGSSMSEAQFTRVLDALEDAMVPA
ncbi:aminotransferase class I/II-fold pyridoxal phosphate-dependent enzyme [Citricoccus sp. SGAir0253]|nr:aminotransferase class I/II-fold pyridoxal phosphate-dependent enzyme [Citricoccus sp. SGAir0253]QCU79297.1 aminotransferase class I/II-fold pyridoxal phosphate-dependent enzyme [Citricoccus sp. SGAir0253]